MEAITIPTRSSIVTLINSLNDEQFNKVAMYAKSISEEDAIATHEEVAALTKEFNKKYEKTFRTLAQ